MDSKTSVRFIILALVLGLSFSAFAAEVQKQGMFVVVTSAAPQTQLMAMVLATHTHKQGKYVRVLLCDGGGDLALQDSQEVKLKPKNKSPQMLLKALIDDGVLVQVCPLYLPNKELQASDLIEGVAEANPPLIAEALMEPGIKLFTF